MDDEMIWKMRVQQAAHAVRELCNEAISEDRLDRLRDLNLTLHEIEREILDLFQEHELGGKMPRRIHPFLKPLMRRLEAINCMDGFAKEWAASKIRIRLKRS